MTTSHDNRRALGHHNEHIISSPNDPRIPRNFNVPLPIDITPKECIKLQNNGKPREKPPSSYLIYRSIFIKELKARGLNVKMPVVSTLSSQSWAKMSKRDRDFYRVLAEQVREYHLIERIKQGKQEYAEFLKKQQMTLQNDKYYSSHVIPTENKVVVERETSRDHSPQLAHQTVDVQCDIEPLQYEPEYSCIQQHSPIGTNMPSCISQLELIKRQLLSSEMTYRCNSDGIHPTRRMNTPCIKNNLDVLEQLQPIQGIDLPFDSGFGLSDIIGLESDFLNAHPCDNNIHYEHVMIEQPSIAEYSIAQNLFYM